MHTFLKKNRTVAIYSKLLLVIFLIVGAACSPTPEAKGPTEAEQFALNVINQRFAERDGRWLALEKQLASNKPRLTELNKPTTQLQARSISETDRMNGITDRYVLSVFHEQIRHWNGNWSEWSAGTGGTKNALTHIITSGLLAYQSYRLEKKNGQWIIHEQSPRTLLTDRTMLAQFMQAAYASPQ